MNTKYHLDFFLHPFYHWLELGNILNITTAPLFFSAFLGVVHMRAPFQPIKFLDSDVQESSENKSETVQNWGVGLTNSREMI